MKLNVLRSEKLKDLFLLGVFVLVAVCSSLAFMQTAEAAASAGGGGGVVAPSTVTFLLEKKFSGPVPEGYTADQFVFTVEGSSFGPETVSLTDFNDDSANGSIELPVGTYSLTEAGPAGFDPSEWTIQWSGAGCENETALSTIIEVDESDLGKDSFGCRADNQWRHGVLTIEKEVVGTTTDVSNFSFVVNHKGNEIFNGPFDGGDVEVAVAIGAYTVLENSAPNYTTSYSDACSGTIEENARVTCTITNTYTPDTNPISGCTDPLANNYNGAATVADGSCTYDQTPISGCTDPLATNYNPLATTDDGSCDYTDNQERTYSVFGYVWHDSNENDVWDGRVGGSDEAETNPEDDLDGWTVIITNGEQTYSTTTDETGYYEFSVPAGTWTISETVEDEWQQTFPNDGVHVVEVIAETADESDIEYNFGNVFVGGGNDNDSSDDDGDDSNVDEGGGRGGGGGGTRPPRCEFSIVGENTEAELVWETRYGRELWITANGEEIFRTTEEDEVDEGGFPYALLTETDFALTVKRFSREETCQISAGPSFGGGGSSPQPQVLGEQVSVVPAGAPNTGAGGAVPVNIPTPTPLFAVLMSHSRHVYRK